MLEIKIQQQQEELTGNVKNSQYVEELQRMNDLHQQENCILQEKLIDVERQLEIEVGRMENQNC